MNIYRHWFSCKCPNDGRRIDYHFELRTQKMIPVEQIISVCSNFTVGFHESIADSLHRWFKGKQTLRARHQGIEIETRRGK